jgi:pyroglutamyl-peptidase
MRCLLTAFQPFDGSSWNASLEGCRAFLAARERGDRPNDLEVRFEVLPVEYGADTVAVEAALLDWRRSGAAPDLILHTGQAAGAREVRVERLAVNVRYADEGQNRALFPQIRIEDEGPAALFSTLPVDEVAAAIKAVDVPGTVSNHAGIYLCNHVLYQSLRRAEREGIAAGRWIGFLHVPALPQQAAPGQPFLSAADIGKAIAVTLEYARRFLEK